jgi:hypothetical protein
MAMCLGIAACSGETAEKKAEEVPDAFAAGTWQVASEVTAMRSTDKTTPAVKAAVGDKENASVCVEKASQQPAPALFSGNGYECTYKSSYIKGGTLNAQLECRRDGVKGLIMMSVSGSYSAKDFSANVDTTTYLTQAGGYQMSRKVHGTVTPGACTPAPAGDDDDDEAADGNATGG